MALTGLKAMLAGAVRDRAASVGVVLFALMLVLTAWGLAVMAAVLALAPRFGMPLALLAVAAGLVLVAILTVWSMSARNRRSSELRATTRALWVATALNAASAVLRGNPAMQDGHEPGPEAEGGQKSHRSMFLIAGGLALILLALLAPGGKDTGQGPGPDGTA
ncbi:hypothetical protein [Rhodobacter sp. SY28-1]|uniref:hypothetical protein n=1 Tax=Rhodobacter sp. SY28-1 TaxID=2562317 RepID=UPI0010BFF3CF|nr:hypothetical protein [Rhodobacter sp. SY28-1]